MLTQGAFRIAPSFTAPHHTTPASTLIGAMVNMIQSRKATPDTVGTITHSTLELAFR